MDTITHALIGASLAHASQVSNKSDQHLKLSHRISLGALAAAFPDIDYITYLIDPLSFISDWHRSVTHSFILLPLWAILLALFFTHITQQKTRLKEAFIICSLSLTSHIFADLITSWGTQIFSPMMDTRFAFGTSFVIDPYFTGIIVTGLIFGLVRHKPRATRVALICLLMYMALQLTFKTQVLNIAKQQVVANHWSGADIYTMPQPFSPLHWKIIVSSGDHYHLSYLNLINQTHLPFLPNPLNFMVQHYRPVEELNWQLFSRYGSSPESELIKKAWHQAEFSRYRKFAVFPAYYSSSQSADEQCHWFMDLRYILPEHQPSFIYAICQNLKDKTLWNVKQMKGRETG